MKNPLKSLITVFNEKRLSTVAGAWVYYFLMSVIPLAFLLATAFSVFGINVLNDLVSTLPEEFRTAGEAIAETAENVSKGATVFFIITVIFSCTTLLNQMSKDGDFIYGIKAKAKRGVFRRLWAIVALGALFAMFILMAFLFAFHNRIFPEGLSSSVGKLILTIVAFSFVILFCYAIIIVLYKYISPVNQKLREFFLGGLFSLSIIVIGTLGLAVYLRYFSSYNALYGSLTAIVVFLLWAYIVMLGLVVGVIVNNGVYERLYDKETLQKKKMQAEKLPALPLSNRRKRTGAIKG